MIDKSSQIWRVLIQFQETGVVLMAHIPTEEQRRGYPSLDRLYPADAWADKWHLLLFTDAGTHEAAKLKARQVLANYVGVTP